MHRQILVTGGIVFFGFLVEGADIGTLKPVARLLTPWSTNVLAGEVHPEYPRPGLVRSDWFSLNGSWNYNISSFSGPHTPERAGTIRVPFPVESYLSGVQTFFSPFEQIKYSKSFTLPKEWAGRRILLHFDGVNWEAKVELNGKRLGVHQGGYDRFTFDITDSLIAGRDQTLTVTVKNPEEHGTQLRGKQVSAPHGIWYTSASGIWQTVWLEPVPDSWVESAKLDSDVDDGTLNVTVAIGGETNKPNLKVEAIVLDHGQEIGRSDGKPGQQFVVAVPNAKLWSPDNPTLYDVKISLSDGGKTLDLVSGYSTPGVTNSYDRLGRLNSVACNGITDTLAYNDANKLLSESYSGGFLNGLSVTNGYDQFLRRTNLTALSSSVLSQTAYSYDNASRPYSVTDGNDNNSATYSYLANSPLVGQITFKQNGTTRMTTTKQYDYLNRLTQISAAPGASYTLPLTFNYSYNPANQRTKDTLADGSYWVYGYDSLGQVTNGCKYFADGTPVAGQQFDYMFDTIGNRLQTMSGGDASGANLRVASYTNNTLNQITSRDVPAYVDIMGASILTNAVTINGQTVYRKQEYYRQQLAANNGASALWTNIIVSGGQSVTGNVYVAREPEVFSYDADGNLTNDGRWSYTWDAENRLTGMAVNTNVGPQYQLTFVYDPKGRRIQKLVASNSVAIYTNRFLYDGWNLVAALNPQSSIIESFMWGSDLSGFMQGAGGVGGLLEVSYYGTGTTNCFPAYDGNGNVMALVNAADGTLAANYDYGPFGEVIRSTGPMAKANPIRFSTKYQDDESDLLYYGYRYYKASTGTWVSRDPIEESGGLNIYEFVDNSVLNKYDGLGRDVNDPQPLPTPLPPPTILPRHSYLTYQVVCPKCQMVDRNSVSVDYSGVSVMPPFEPTYPHNSLGGLGDVKGINCSGDPVTITAYMETRFVNAPFPLSIWNQYNINEYQRNTRISYNCVPCKWSSF